MKYISNIAIIRKYNNQPVRKPIRIQQCNQCRTCNKLSFSIRQLEFSSKYIATTQNIYIYLFQPIVIEVLKIYQYKTQIYHQTTHKIKRNYQFVEKEVTQQVLSQYLTFTQKQHQKGQQQVIKYNNNVPISNQPRIFFYCVFNQQKKKKKRQPTLNAIIISPHKTSASTHYKKGLKINYFTTMIKIPKCIKICNLNGVF
eukprot:TRINITY_DN40971_c0_g1_i1.p2 TRINITY_DN40971_c0_g1~~TRINITY_DN40971_c0_g1_i1.p2  ORF type:complete len:199 (+),score=-11.70 TRINITY_DN40971_c0_g1_i1:739-1335(+)